MKGLIAILLGMNLVLLSCKSQDGKINYKLSDRQLTQLMYDVQLSDAAVISVPGARGDSLKQIFWDRLTTVYGMSKADIKIEIEKLESDPDKMKAVFDSIKVWSDTIE